MSISAGSLRIGNWFIPVMDDGTELEARQVNVNELLAVSVNSDRAKGIKLSDDILENFGFVWETKSKRHLQLTLPEQGLNSRRISFYYNDYGECETIQLYMSDYFDGMFEIKPTRFVHQLQNLYHSLTGNELTLSKPF